MADTPATTGAGALHAFLTERRISFRAAGEALHVSGTTVWHWCNGVKAPSRARRLDIETWTSGAVPQALWGEVCTVAPFAEGSEPRPGTAATGSR